MRAQTRAHDITVSRLRLYVYTGSFGCVLLKSSLLIFSDLILKSRVDCGIPSLAAAPDGPDTLPLLSAKAASMSSFSWAAIRSESTEESR